MTRRLYGNNAATTTTASLATGATSIAVASVTNFPTLVGSDWFMATLDDGTNIEIVKVTALSTLTYTIVREQEGTTSPVSFAASTKFEIRSTKASYEDILAVSHPRGRLTLATLTPIMTTNQAAKTTIYYTPYNGNFIPIYNGTVFYNMPFVELSVATSDATKSPAAIGASKVNDWFIWNDAGTIRLGHGPDWTNDTTRSAGTALVLVNGIYLNNASITNGPAASRGTYVGTTRSNASSQLDWILGGDANDGSPASLFVWNMYNRCNVSCMIRDTRASHSWTTASYQGINGAVGMRVTVVQGLVEDSVSTSFTMIATTTSNAVTSACGIGVDSVSTNSGSSGYTFFSSVNTNIIASTANYSGFLGLGVHYVAALEYGGTNATQYGISAPAQSGMVYNGRM